MTTRTVSLRFHEVLGSQGGLARSGPHVVIADRPEGVAGGQSLGFNGAELLLADLGGCFRNDLHYTAEACDDTLRGVDVEVEITLSGAPLRFTAATSRAQVQAGSSVQARACFEAPCRDSTIGNSMRGAFPVAFELDD